MTQETKIWASRLSKIPPYLFAQLDEIKEKYKKETGESIIDFSEGNPSIPPHPSLVKFLQQKIKIQENYRYPSYQGKLSARQAISEWYKKRFNVELDPETEVAILIGSKEGIAHLFWALVDKDDEVYLTSPGYPVYLNQTYLVGGRVNLLPLYESNDFLPDIAKVKFKKKTKLICLNYPNNPTGSVAPYAFYNDIVNLAFKHNFYCFNDNVYSEIYYFTPPHSILEIPGAKERCVEFHSLSKTFSVCGWRIGFVVGNKKLIQGLLKIKQNVDSGPYGAIQDALIYALKNIDYLSTEIRRTYKDRISTLNNALNSLGWESRMPKATFYLWCKIPSRKFKNDSLKFSIFLLKKTGILVCPGIGFGQYGEGYIRFAVVPPETKIKEATLRLSKI
jgi:LL-diaminopimelate aminotransferase